MHFARHPLKPGSRIGFQQNHLTLGHIPRSPGTVTVTEGSHMPSGYSCHCTKTFSRTLFMNYCYHSWQVSLSLMFLSPNGLPGPWLEDASPQMTIAAPLPVPIVTTTHTHHVPGTILRALYAAIVFTRTTMSVIISAFTD